MKYYFNDSGVKMVEYRRWTSLVDAELEDRAPTISVVAEPMSQVYRRLTTYLKKKFYMSATSEEATILNLLDAIINEWLESH